MSEGIVSPMMTLPINQIQPSPSDAESQTSPFSCNICHKTYTRVDHLARHVRSHTQEKPFSCPVCGKSFARADLLKRHSANHEESPDGRKRRRLNQPQSRVAQACIACASSKLRCSGDEPCKRCHQKNLECRYNKPRTSIVPDDLAIANEQLNPNTAATQSEWFPTQPLPNQNIVAGSQYHHHHHHQHPASVQSQTQSLSPGRSRSLGGGNQGPPRGAMIQAPMQMPTPASTGNPADVGVFPDALYDVNGGMDHYDSSFADFLKDVMMADPVHGDPSQANMDLNKSFLPFDLLDFAGGDAFNFLTDTYNSFQPQEPQDQLTNQPQKPAHTRAQSNSGHATPVPNGGIRLGAQAFKDSTWLYAPSQSNFVGADKNNMFLPLENLVTKTKYHGPPPCDSLNAAARDRILATILAESSRHIIPAVVASFPSAELLTNLMHQFFIRHERNDNSWIHAPTFNPNQQHPEFLMSVIGAGAVTSDLPQIRSLGFAFQESARRTVTEQIERDNRTIRQLRPLQTYALHLDVGMWSGDRRRLELSESHSFILVTMIRRGGFFRQPPTKCPLPSMHDSVEVTESKWKQWVERESFKRLAFHLLIRDAYSSITLINPPMFSPSEVLVELPASPDLWHAKTSFEWRDIYLHRRATSHGSPIPTLRAAADDLSLITNFLDIIDIPLTNILILCSLWSLSWQYRELIRLNVSNPGGNSSLITKSLYQEICQTMQRFKLYSSDWLSSSHYGDKSQPLAQILHERILLNLHASLEDVQLFAGKAGEDEARRSYPLLSAWSQSRESRQAVWYAGQIVKAAKEYPQQMLQEFSAVSLYHASLVFWAWSVVLNHNNGANPGMGNNFGWSMPSGGMLGVGMIPGGDVNGMSQPQQHHQQQIVLMDGEDTADVQRFIVLGKGIPAITSTTSLSSPLPQSMQQPQTPMSAREPRTIVIPISDAKGVMVAMTDLLKRNNLSSGAWNNFSNMNNTTNLEDSTPMHTPGTQGHGQNAVQLQNQNSNRDEELVPLVSNLSKLMKSLGNAAKGIKAAGVVSSNAAVMIGGNVMANAHKNGDVEGQLGNGVER